MKLFQEPTTAGVALRALKTVAMANGVFDHAERALLRAAAQLYEAPLDPDAPPLGGEELARCIQAPEDRAKLVDDCVLMSLADEDASPEEWRVLREYGQALSLPEEVLRQSYDHAYAQRRLAQHELMRRQYAEMLRELSARRGPEGLRLFFAQNPEDPARAWRYRRLGLLPKKSLGHELWRYCRVRDFGLPGEAGGLPEELLWHDLLHVLTGYDTTPDGELALGAFTAGMTRRPLFPFLFFVMLSFQDGLSLSPKKLQRAYLRGQAASQDLTQGWELWPHAERPVAALALDYNLAED